MWKDKYFGRTTRSTKNVNATTDRSLVVMHLNDSPETHIRRGVEDWSQRALMDLESASERFPSSYSVPPADSHTHTFAGFSRN